MHISFFQFAPHYGGGDRSTLEIASRLKPFTRISIIDPHGSCDRYREEVARRGIEYHILKQRAQRYDIGGTGAAARLVRFASYLPHMYALARRLDQVLEKIQPDVICTHSFKSALVLRLSRLGRRIPCVYYLRNWYRPPQMTFSGKMLCRHHAAAIIAVSYATQNAVICANMPFHKIKVVQNPIDIDAFEKLSQHPPSRPLPKQDAPTRILLPAGILPVKGQLYAIRAMPEVLKTYPDAVLWLAGDDQSEVPHIAQYVQQLKSAIRRLQLEESVFFLGGRDDISTVMRLSTHVILPTTLEGHPRVILEAMALKRPVITTAAGGCTDMVIPGLTGYLAEFESEQSLAAAILRAKESPAQTETMAETAYAWVKREFTTESHTQKLLEVFRGVCSGGAESGS